MADRAIVLPILPYLPTCPKPQCNMRRDAPRRLRRSRDCARRRSAALAFVARPYAHGLSFVVRAAEMQGTARTLADLDTGARRSEREIAIPTGARTAARARSTSRRAATRAALLVVRACIPPASTNRGWSRWRGSSSASGVTVVTPDIPELSRFEITPAITDAIEQAAVWLASRAGARAATARSA